jgi:AraC-like DNA-binding protein
MDGGHETADSGPEHGSGDGASEQRGRLSNPVQRRLSDTEIDDLVAQYEAPRRSPRKLTNPMVDQAAHRYSSGETLAEIAAHFNVSPSTLTRELRLAGIPIKRRGRPGRH